MTKVDVTFLDASQRHYFEFMLTPESRRFPLLGEVFFCIRTLPNH